MVAEILSAIGEFLTQLSIGAAVAIVGSVFAFFSFLLQYFGKGREWEKADIKHDQRLTKLEIEQQNLKETVTENHDDLSKRIDDLRDDSDRRDEELRQANAKMDTKLDRLTDIIINYFKDRQV